VLRTHWDELAPDARAAIERRTGPVQAAYTASAGKNSALAVILTTARGSVFVKGRRRGDPGVVSQGREAAISPYVYPVCPALLWRTEVDEWNLLGFEHTPGRHADYTPESDDLPKVVAAIRQLGALTCPDLPHLKRAEQRWAAYVDDGDDLGLLSGDALLHTDYSPDNVLINGPVARLIDWAWPTKGAAFIDPACLVVRLVFAGHIPAQAESQVAALPGWSKASPRAIDVFATALARMWAQIADADPSPWKRQMAASAESWWGYRCLPE
jgi:hypothetical protein